MPSYEISPDVAAAVAARIAPEKKRGAGRFYYEGGSLYVDADGAADVETVLATIDPTAPTLPKRQFGFLEFMSLFTPDEQAAIVNSSEPTVKLFLLMAAGAAYIDLDDSRTIEGLEELATLGLITAARKDAVLAGQAPLS